MPDISYKILKKQSDWKELLNFSLNFVKHFYSQIVDKKSQKMLSLFDQEINPQKRTENYQNPYYSTTEKPTQKQGGTKPKKAIRKGPQLGSSSRSDL